MRRHRIMLVFILLLIAIVVVINLPKQPGFITSIFKRDIKPVLGLDLTGGVQVLLSPPAGFKFTAENLKDAQQILENRVNGLGTSEVVFQTVGENYIMAEFPDVKDRDMVNNLIQQTGLMEWVGSDTRLEVDSVITTDYSGSQTPSSLLSQSTQQSVTTGTTLSPTTEPLVYHTVITGADLKSVAVTSNPNDPTAGIFIAFELNENGAMAFGDYTTNNVGKYVAIVLDKKVISCPGINEPITGGKGIIQGSFTRDTANQLATVLRYGSLPVPLEIAQSRVIGPTLGQDSLNKSMLAGIIGFALVALFMIIYYRLPGLLAVFSIIIYALMTFTIFELIPVTLTLPGIAGFLLSTGGALDANILIFERMKEELRNGRTLIQAIDLGWKRAWPSIRDSNIATLITSAILFFFGSAFGASIVKGFAVTLTLGVLVSLFTALFVTRSFLDLTLDIINPAKHQKWFGA
jgi:preprotein translocase subunit SecD